MHPEDEVQFNRRALTTEGMEDFLAEIDAIDLPAETSVPAPVEIPASPAQPVTPEPGAGHRFKTAIDAWFKRKAAYDANPSTFENLLNERGREKKRKSDRLEYRAKLGRDIRGYETGQTPERKAEKKAAKSKGERVRREARSTPEQIEADKQAARDRAKKSRENAKAKKQAEAEAEQAALQNHPNFGIV